MPIMVVYGLSEFHLENRTNLINYNQALRDTLNDFPELGLRSGQMSVYFPVDFFNLLGEEIVIKISGMPTEGRATDDLREWLKSIVRLTHKFFATALVEVIIESFDPGLSYLEKFHKSSKGEHDEQ